MSNREQAEALLKTLKQCLDKTDKFIKEMEKLGVKVRVRIMVDVMPQEEA